MSPLTSQITRAELLKLVRQEVRTSAFERITVNSLFDKVTTAQKTATVAREETKALAVTVNQTSKEKTVAGKAFGTLVKFQPNGMYYAITLDFALGKQTSSNTPNPELTDEEKADWGTGFGNPLVNPKKDCIYVVRATIEQLRVDPMIGGFKLKWIAPAGWSKWDPLPMTHLVEASSNPILLARKFKSPSSTIKNVVFRCQVVAFYP